MAFDRLETTRMSLIERLHDARDQHAWLSFVEIYYPAILNALKSKGLQQADAEDAAQQVLMSISRSLAHRPHDRNIARFRTWLETVIRNAALNALQRQPRDRGIGGDESISIELQSWSDEQLLEHEHRMQLLRTAAANIKHEFSVDVWESFWRTTIQGEDIEVVANILGKSLGSVYAARSRVMKRLRQEVDRLNGFE
jgi:RNA polymerase sigma factor (sigma-70 family)